ncbi:histidine phosphatase family protein [Frankia sp. AgB1.9]|uniref:histidine phosphatase family protein n=1 Tax=unclassified Frankia TaxID=2632575 RepID=UPI001934AE63|nr:MULTISPECIES: histidine phosphatase family protein [unclassified Frankia]MBL7492929.1 histidine phosphatase family protein [Frankia sp. AgW1.1]MBL7550543.1 histidine phosphatase family protein [Frankia sp. AgB1.9]MBL7624941.1 histidine phosphatase family protein [Frankia sp. AgB1.8]
MVVLVLVRHALSVRPTLDGPDDHHRPLTEAGHEQAVALTAALVGFGASQVVSSPYLRAVQTIEPTAQALGLPVHHRDDLREWRSGLTPTPDWQAHYKQSWTQPDLAIGTGETLTDLTKRARNAARDLVASAAPMTATLAATHGTWIARALLALGLSIDCTFWLSMPMPAIYKLSFDGPHLHSAVGPGLNQVYPDSPSR